MHHITTTTNAAIGHRLPVTGRQQPATNRQLKTGNRQLLKHTCRFFFAMLISISFNISHAQDVLVGLTSNGGPDNKGTAFSIKSTGANFTLMQTFADWGKTPSEDLVLGNDGNFYGTASTGGLYNNGTIFKVTPAGAVTVI
ncbi:MAG TPA: choice-of-anchor tandem repeat GloVer-containing protein, partial [Parafilimonas sp.]|nr:choice-of-anchor tandem repeat GloVer-containing protein [Parafilimonas sp.]